MAIKIQFPNEDEGTIHERVAVLMLVLGLDKGEGYGASYFTGAHRRILHDALQVDPSCSSYAQLFKLMWRLDRNERLVQDAAEAFDKVRSLAHS